MKHKSGFIVTMFVLLFSFLSCEKDDVCLSPMTPKLVFRLYDNVQIDDLKEAEHLYIIALPDNDTVYKDVQTDSIAISLDVNQDAAKYIFVKDNNNDTVLCTYQRKNIFVSKACGYKTNFYQLDVEKVVDADNWILNLNVENQEVTNDTLAHVKIYH